ncbi:hypothetical protein BCR44DRAFT_1437847 [Catenaria anguillulae PL171]|uniref:Uncharacterized protein n=1 Tax=Catenaria anguillulae PL171 TaxID=765915 RepID=A0A1Y2HID4_9FUNG|nr:hypothetical protein BCR44DRAFT_1437847 [Catenaria anguillulae PL171]
MSSTTNPQPRTGIPRPKVAPPPNPSASSTGRRPIGNPRTGLQPSQSEPAANRASDLSSIMSGLSLAHSRPPSSSQTEPSTKLSSTVRHLAPTSNSTTARSRSADDDDDDDIQILPSSTPSRPLSSSSQHSLAETKAALRALNSLVSSFTGPLSMAQVDAIQAILYPPTRPTEAPSLSDDVLSDLAHITAFPGTRLARAAESGSGHNGDDDDNEPFADDVLGGDLTKARPVKPPGELLVKNAPSRSVAHRALAMKLAEHRKRKEEERNGVNGSEQVLAPGTPAAAIKSETPLRSSRVDVSSTPATTPGHGSVPSTAVKPPAIVKREPVDTLDRVLLEVSAKTKAATGGSSKVLGLGTASRLGGVGLSGTAQTQGQGKRRLVKPVQPPTL